MTETTKTPSVLFVCSKNGGKSQLAAGLMNQLADGRVTVHSAGTKPGQSLNPQAVESLTELGIDITGEHPKPVTDEVLDTVDVVIVLGTEAKVEPHEGTRFEVWERTSPPNAASKAWNACAWSGTTSRPGSRCFMRS
ncbi:arsenate-mycothiol transferase [Arthrobacter sp. UYEF20]